MIDDRMSNRDKKPKTEIDERMLECIDELIKNRQYKSYAELLRELSWGSGKRSVVKSGKAGFTAGDIGSFLILNPEFDGHWILTGKRSMHVNSYLEVNSELILYLYKEIEELKKMNCLLLKENGALEGQLKLIKANYVDLH